MLPGTAPWSTCGPSTGSTPACPGCRWSTRGSPSPTARTPSRTSQPWSGEAMVMNSMATSTFRWWCIQHSFNNDSQVNAIYCPPPGSQCTCTSCPPAWGSARTPATGRAWWSSTARGWASARQASSATTRCGGHTVINTTNNTEMLMNNSNKTVYQHLGLGVLVDCVPSGPPPLHSLCCWPGKQTFPDKSVNKYK